MATWRGLNWQRSMYGPAGTPEYQPPTVRTQMDLPPPPPAVVAPAEQSSWEREFQAPAVGPNPYARFSSSDTSSWDPESFPTGQFVENATIEDRAALAYSAGFRGDDLVTMVAISMGEETPGDPWSQGRYSATDNTGENEGKWQRALGLWQIRPLTDPDDPRWAASDGWRDPAKLLDPEYQAYAAKKEFEQKGFEGWDAYNNGSYEQYLDEARSAVERLGLN